MGVPGTVHRPPQQAKDAPLATYRARRDFARTPEPADKPARGGTTAPIFVVQKHAARRLHWDFRLEHGGVLWSWAVPKGPSLDTGDKRLAVRTEDHPLAYADFAGDIPEGQYGAGHVETWDRGIWRPVGKPAEQLAAGELKFDLDGARLHGRFVLVRMKPRPRERGENWLLIKERDADARSGADAPTLEAGVPEAAAEPRPPAPAPAPGAQPGKLPSRQALQLARLADAPPTGEGWLSEVKFDGYRLLAFLDADRVRLITRGGLDWTDRLPGIAAAVAKFGPRSLLLDGELVALRPDGRSDFARLQQALSDGKDAGLSFYAFDLLHLDGWDLRPCRLADRKAALAGLSDWQGRLRYSDHADGATAELARNACALGLEGLICKRADAPYRAGRGGDWLKLKCSGREELVVLGWTDPEGSRTGLGALHLGYHDTAGRLHYAGGVGTGFTARSLAALRKRLDPLAATPPAGLLYAEDAPDPRLHWVRPDLVAEVRFAGWSGAGRLRHAVFLGLREDKMAKDVVRPVADPTAERQALGAAPKRRTRIVGGPAAAKAVVLTHPDKELWPGITKQDLADYWAAVAPHALGGIAQRPLALVRCPDGIGGAHFFQKHAGPGVPAQFRAGAADGAPYLAIDDADGLAAAAQASAIELHSWGAAEADPLHPDRLVFDLDPGDGVAQPAIVAAAQEVRARLRTAGLESFCRTSGGKGLHVVAPLRPKADWDAARAWCRAFAEAMATEHPDRYVATVSKARRRGRILVDWLRNGLGATAVASFSPRARPGATVATPLAWLEVVAALDPARFTIATIPARLKRQKRDPWAGFDALRQELPTNG